MNIVANIIPNWDSRFISYSIFIALFFILPSNRPVYGEEKGIILEESGIHYPGGFDLNTVGEVQGRASHFSRPGKGPVSFLLATDRELYTVLTSPFWYWHENQVKILRGERSLRPGVEIIRERREAVHCRAGNTHFIFRTIFRIPGKGRDSLMEESDLVRERVPGWGWRYFR